MPNTLLQPNKEHFLGSIRFNIENLSESQKRIDSMAEFRRTIAPANAITLRCNYSTNRVNEKRAAARH